jgi:hypothetical protein
MVDFTKELAATALPSRILPIQPTSPVSIE